MVIFGSMNSNGNLKNGTLSRNMMRKMMRVVIFALLSILIPINLYILNAAFGVDVSEIDFVGVAWLYAAIAPALAVAFGGKVLQKQQEMKRELNNTQEK